MIIVKREAQATAPGHEPEHLKLTLENFFCALDGAFPGKRIIWRDWDHARFDKLASYLRAELGYSAGAPFLTAYGYTIETDDNVLCPEAEDEPVESTADAVPETVTETAPVEMQEKSPAPKQGMEAQSARDKAQPEATGTVHTGRIIRVLGNKNSGFVRDDASGDDYYFNICSFTQWADALAPGRAVSFRLARRFDRRQNRMRENAVELSYVE